MIYFNYVVIAVVASLVYLAEIGEQLEFHVKWLNNAVHGLAFYTQVKYLQDEPVVRHLQDTEHSDQVSTISGLHFNHSSSHTRAWHHLYEVNGLKNEEVVVVVTSTATKNGYLLRERVIASSRTWMRLFANVVVVIEDTFEVRFSMRHCEQIEYSDYTTFNCHNEPTWLLSRNCNADYYGADGPCCKVDDAINYLVNVRSDWFKTIKYMLHSDDDTYWRPDQVLRWLAAVENSGANNYPLISNLELGDDNNHGVWRIKGCNEIHTTGWYQPVMLNHILLNKMSSAVSSYGIKDTCRNFDVTHDIGLGIFAWLFQSIHIHMPSTYTNGNHRGINAFHPTDLAMHYVKHYDTEHCDDNKDNNWLVSDRYNQKVVLGCGDLNHPIHNHNSILRADMYDAWKYYRNYGQNTILNTVGISEFINSYVIINENKEIIHILKENLIIGKNNDGSFQIPNDDIILINNTKYILKKNEYIVERVIPRLMQMRGYSTTNHSKVNDITKIWKPFTLQDCQIPGVKEN